MVMIIIDCVFIVMSLALLLWGDRNKFLSGFLLVVWTIYLLYDLSKLA